MWELPKAQKEKPKMLEKIKFWKWFRHESTVADWERWEGTGGGTNINWRDRV